MEVGFYFKRIAFNDKTELLLQENTILLITGPNNSGKSRFLNELQFQTDNYHTRRKKIGPVLEYVEKDLKGTWSALQSYIEAEHDLTDDKQKIKSSYSSDISIDRMRKDFDEKKQLHPFIESRLTTHLSAAQRLQSSGPRNSFVEASTILFNNEPLELKVSNIFRKAFGTDLVLDRTTKSAEFKVMNRKNLPKHQNRLTPEFKKFMKKQESLQHQGDGIRSFTSILLQILVQPRNVILIDEPEVFLHPPQIRQLARTIARDAPESSQIMIATHSDEFVRALLDYGSKRVVVARISRHQQQNNVSILESEKIRTLWSDPLLRSSSALSALFHNVAVVCEGETDSRFFQHIIGEIMDDESPLDCHFFHTSGIEKMPIVVEALCAVNIPVVAVSDLDALSDIQRLKRLTIAAKGRFEDIEKELKVIHHRVENSRMPLTGDYFASQIEEIAKGAKGKPQVPNSVRENISKLIKQTSPWTRVKEDGYVAFGAGEGVKAFKAVEEALFSWGLILIQEGELENLCRTIPKSNKPRWLEAALQKSIKDEEMETAQKFGERLMDGIKRSFDISEVSLESNRRRGRPRQKREMERQEQRRQAS